MSHDTRPITSNHASAAAIRVTNPSCFAPAADPRQQSADAIERLCAALDAAFDTCRGAADPSHHASFARGVRVALVEAAAAAMLLAPSQREGAAQSYRRHLLAADPHGRYAIASLVWLPGQASPVHAHHTWCGYVVLDGTLTEAVYAWNEAENHATQTRAQPRPSGAVSFTRAGRSGIHRLGNASAALAVSLHVYGVPETRFATHVNDVVRCADLTESSVSPSLA
jgi:predicted metal-dependent enzyme (double-stranded beta helix superfamily)